MNSDFPTVVDFAQQTFRSIPTNETFQQDEFETVGSLSSPPQQQENTPPSESLGMSVLRTAYQPVAGYLSSYTYPLDLLEIAGKGLALAESEELDPARLAELKKMFPDLDIPEEIDKEKYQKNLQEQAEYFPTQSTFERGIESQTGLPLTPQNYLQNLLRFGGLTGGFKGGSILDMATAGTVGSALKGGLEYLGAPEWLSDIAGMAAGQLSPTPKISAAKKPSGLPTRQYEKIKKPTRVTPTRYEKITDTIEQDFRKAAGELVEEKSLTARAMAEDPGFKEKIIDVFDSIRGSAANIEGTAQASNLRRNFRKQLNDRDFKGLTLSEYEKSYLKEANKINKQLSRLEQMTPLELLDQYRKNNVTLGEIFESGKSKAQNRAKADALISYNKAIAKTIDELYPDTEFSNLFRFGNKRWEEIKNIENFQEAVDKVFDGKIKFDQAEKYFSSPKVKKSVEKTLGKEGYNNFKELLGDFVSQKEAYKKLKIAGDSLPKEAIKTMGIFALSPIVAKLRIVGMYGNRAYQTLLTSPQLQVKWKSGLEKFKKGNYQGAIKEFKEIEESIK